MIKFWFGNFKICEKWRFYFANNKVSQKWLNFTYHTRKLDENVFSTLKIIELVRSD